MKRYNIGPPNVVIVPMEDVVTGELPSQRREKRLTDTKAALIWWYGDMSVKGEL
jgi:hypothetical protein